MKNTFIKLNGAANVGCGAPLCRQRAVYSFGREDATVYGRLYLCRGCAESLSGFLNAEFKSKSADKEESAAADGKKG
ncbi:MAG: hypothetical protein LBQ40_00165 [Clostridiales bacterium]|jgi:hypothetical protein|nr:hypothetical protein [Clostridiales bacterium]